jgi:hypothetical protein
MSLDLLLRALQRLEVVQFIVAVAAGWLIHRLTTRNAQLVSYMSHVQSVTIPAQAQVQRTNVSTFSLFLWNQGNAPAKHVEVGHYFLPDHSVYPDVARTNVSTPGGGTAIQIHAIPPKVLVVITYLLLNISPATPVVSHVNYDLGPARLIQVNLQRIFPKWLSISFAILAFLGIYTLVGWLLRGVAFL